MTTIEDGFEYRMTQILKEMRPQYAEEMEERKINGESVDTFSNWLWNERDDLGARVFEDIEAYAGMDEITDSFNVES